VEGIRSEGKTVLVVDSGHLFNDTPTSRAPDSARLITRAYKRMGIAAVNVGDSDLKLGLSFLRQEASRGFPLISANLMARSRGTPIFPPYIIKKAEGVRVAFFGLLSPDMSPSVRKTMGKRVVIKDPVETAKAVMEVLRKQADIIILLSDLGLDKEREILRKVTGIHVVLGGREGQYTLSPIWERETPILQSYKKGMYAGKLQFTISDASFHFEKEGQKGANRIQWTLIPLDNSLPEDKAISGWIRKAGFAGDIERPPLYR
jgi:5'-nucleotidase